MQSKDEAFHFGILQGIGAIGIEQAIAEHKILPLEQSGKLENQLVNTFLTSPVPMKRILIVTTWRSGSTFLGEIIQSAPGVFYSYEPLYYFEQHSGSKTELIQSLFRCQFSANYLRFINGLPENSQNFMLMNRRVWEACQHNRTLCYRPEFVGELCSYFPIHLIKVVRLRIKELSSLLADEKSSKDWKIVYLVRDPRGVMSSRANLPWCQPDPACNDPERLCAEVEEDLEWEKRLRSQFPDRHYFLKFEDLAANVQTETEKLFRFLGMPISDPVKVFLAKHTQSNETRANPFSTIRQSNTVASEWQTKLASSEILNITNVCTPLLKTLNILL
jgi:hypothetical protein